MPRRIVVFRLDRNPLVCRARIRHLRRINPGVPIMGLYGGPGGYRRLAFRLGSRLLLHLDAFYATGRAPHWNWKHGDLALAAWYRDVGHRHEFDVLHLVEWDLLLLAPLHELYRRIPDEALGLTAYTPLRHVGDDWEWMRLAEPRAETEELLRRGRDTWGFTGEPFVCLMGAACFPRSFLEAYVAHELPEVGHDEVRLPMFASILNFPVEDTGFRSSWREGSDDAYFNAFGKEIDPQVIIAELKRAEGRRAFHPVRRTVHEVDRLPFLASIRSPARRRRALHGKQ